MDAPGRLALAALIVTAGAVGLLPDAGVAGATSPDITVTVDGSPVDDGNETAIDYDPPIGVSVDAGRSLDVVSVRVDGTTERRYTPNGSTLNETFYLDLVSGEHSLTVVVKAGGVTTHEVTLTKDAQRPYVAYNEPFETETHEPPPKSVTVNASRVTFAGNFSDLTGVSHLLINRSTAYDTGVGTRTDRTVYEAETPNDSFTQSIFLGVGDNIVTARYYDELNHVRVHRLTVTVQDTAPPTLANLSAVRTGPETLRVRGRTTDNGQIRSLSLTTENDDSTTYLLEPGIGEPDPERQQVAFESNVTLHPGATAVVLRATDTAGNTVERTVSVRRTVVPELRLDRGGTRYVNGSTVVARGMATDGEIVSATIETVDPATGEVVDLVSLHDGDIVTDLSFERHLAAPEGRNATVQLRVIDSRGTEHVTTLDRTLTVETPTATPTATPAPSATPSATPTPATPAPTTTPAAESNASGLTIPLIGVTVPVPDILGASVSLPIPVVGPLDVPLVPVGALLVVGLGVVGLRR